MHEFLFPLYLYNLPPPPPDNSSMGSTCLIPSRYVRNRVLVCVITFFLPVVVNRYAFLDPLPLLAELYSCFVITSLPSLLDGFVSHYLFNNALFVLPGNVFGNIHPHPPCPWIYLVHLPFLPPPTHDVFYEKEEKTIICSLSQFIPCYTALVNERTKYCYLWPFLITYYCVPVLSTINTIDSPRGDLDWFKSSKSTTL